MGFSIKHALLVVLILFNLSTFGLNKNEQATKLLQKAEQQLSISPDSALLTLNNCQNYLDLNNISELSFKYYYLLSATLFESESYTQSAYIIKKLIRNYQSNKLHINIADAYTLLGNNYLKQKNYKLALEYFLKAKGLYEADNNKLKALQCNNLTGIVFCKLEQYYLAEESFKLSLDYAKNYHNEDLIIECFYQLTKVYLYNSNVNITKAKTYLLNYLKHNHNTNNDYLAELYFKLGLQYLAENHMDSALTYILKAKKSNINYTQVSQAEIFLNLGIIAKQQHNLSLSKRYFSSAISESNKTPDLSILSEAYKHLASINIWEGNDSIAFNNMKEALLLKDSLIQAKATEINEIEDVNKNSELDNFNRENFEFQQTKIDNQNTLIVTLTVALILFLSLIILVVYFTQKIARVNKRLKRINHKLNEKNNELNKTLSTRDKLISTIAHDIKNPLGIISGFAELILYHVEDNKIGRIKSYANQIFNSTNNLLSLLENLLQWAKSQNYRIRLFPENLYLKTEVDENFRFFETMANNKKISLRNECNENHLLYVDKTTFNTALRNLINNAIKFTETNGIIRINSELNNNKLLIHIQDNGIGIQSDNLEQIFSNDDKQHIGQHYGKGTGIGLNLSYEFVKLNAGDIKVHSKPNVGSCFTISLPTNSIKPRSA